MIELDMATKRCTKCGETKPLSGFYRNGGRGDGRHSWCAACQGAHAAASNARKMAEDPDGFRERQREVVARHRARTGNARGKALNRARSAAIAALIEAHRKEYEALLRVAKYERGLL